MRQYKDPEFGVKVAEHAMDLLDDGIFRAGRRSAAAPLPGNNLERANLGRAGASTSRQARETLEAMHAVEGAWLDVCKVTLPSHLPPEYAERLQAARWELLDISDELEEIWQAKAKAIWAALPVESRVRRLRKMAEEVRGCDQGTEERKFRAEHLSFRIQLDPEAARMAGFDGVDSEAEATAPRSRPGAAGRRPSDTVADPAAAGQAAEQRSTFAAREKVPVVADADQSGVPVTTPRWRDASDDH